MIKPSAPTTTEDYHEFRYCNYYRLKVRHAPDAAPDAQFTGHLVTITHGHEDLKMIGMKLLEIDSPKERLEYLSTVQERLKRCRLHLARPTRLPCTPRDNELLHWEQEEDKVLSKQLNKVFTKAVSTGDVPQALF